jgi:Protein of unknown function (DUF1501)
MEPLRLSRRAVIAGVGLGWLARSRDARADPSPGRALVSIWLAGGPSQLETFDPHPGARIAGGTRAIRTRAPAIELAEGFEQLANEAQDIALVRSVVSREADHQRATYLTKTGYSPGGGVTHASIGAVFGHANEALQPSRFPPQISLLSGPWPAKGGMLGARFDAFVVEDPGRPVADLVGKVPPEQRDRRLADARFIDRAFASKASARHDELTRAALDVMNADETRAFDLDREPAADLARYGRTPFGRACVVARRLLERGARAIEITLDGWDTHTDNHARHRALAAVLDPALSALLADLRARDLLRKTVVLCGGEFGRTPTVNALGGRDHWSRGFSVLVAGGGLRGGFVVGATDPDGAGRVIQPHPIADVHATALRALGVDPATSVVSASGRPIAYSDGTPIAALLAKSEK